MELTTEQIKQIYDEHIAIVNCASTNVIARRYFELLEIEKDHVHALIKSKILGVGDGTERYHLTVIRDDDDVPVVCLIHSWGADEYPLARIAFRCFCHEEPEEIGKMWENNRQIALYSDEARHKDELISELIDRSGAL